MILRPFINKLDDDKLFFQQAQIARPPLQYLQKNFVYT